MELTRLIPHRFSSAALEKTFLVEYGRTFLPQRRVAAGMALAIWSAFFFWDWVQSLAFSHTAFIYVVVIRVSGILFFIYLLRVSWKVDFAIDRYATAWMIAGVFVAWFGLLGMMLVAPPNNTFREYYPGLLLVYYFLLTFLRLRAKYAAAVGLVCFIAFNIVELILNSNLEYKITIGIYTWFSSSFFLICFYITGAMIASQLEISFREDFLARRALKDARGKASAATLLLKNRMRKCRSSFWKRNDFFRQPITTSSNHSP